MEPVQYLRAVRRRWKIIAVCVLLGLALGYVSSIGAQKKHDETTYWRATYTLYYDATAASDKGGAFTQLPQLGLLTTSGDVPAKIAQANGVDVNSLTARIQTETNAAAGHPQDHRRRPGRRRDGQPGQPGRRHADAVHQRQEQRGLPAAGRRRHQAGRRPQGPDRRRAATPPPGSLEAQEHDALNNQYRLALDNELSHRQPGPSGPAPHRRSRSPRPSRSTAPPSPSSSRPARSATTTSPSATNASRTPARSTPR